MLKFMPLIGSVLLTIIIVGFIVYQWRQNRRKIGQAVAGSYVRSTCCGDTTTPMGWTQDGWVSRCDACGEWQYLGDDHDNPPPGFNRDGTPSSRRPLPIPAASGGPALTGATGRRPTTEVTSGCDLCGGVLDHEANCPRGVLLDMMPDQMEPEGDLAMPPQPNIGGEGNPDYQGPHYESVHGLETRFVPYDMLGEPIPGAAVSVAGDAACAGPIARDRGYADTRRTDDDS